MDRRAAEVIDPRDLGLRTLDLEQPLFDDAALVRADQALEALADDMRRWLQADIERLHNARIEAERNQWSFASLEALLSVAHDIKGTGATYGSPLSSRLAASLCRSIETSAGKRAAQRDPTLACAHVDALRAASRDPSGLDPVGHVVLRELEAHVDALGVAPR